MKGNTTPGSGAWFFGFARAVRDSTLTTSERAVAWSLALRANDRGETFVGVPLLTSDAGLKSVRSAQRALRVLQDAGIVVPLDGRPERCAACVAQDQPTCLHGGVRSVTRRLVTEAVPIKARGMSQEHAQEADSTVDPPQEREYPRHSGGTPEPPATGAGTPATVAPTPATGAGDPRHSGGRSPQGISPEDLPKRSPQRETHTALPQAAPAEPGGVQEQQEQQLHEEEQQDTPAMNGHAHPERTGLHEEGRVNDLAALWDSLRKGTRRHTYERHRKHDPELAKNMAAALDRFGFDTCEDMMRWTFDQDDLRATGRSDLGLSRLFNPEHVDAHAARAAGWPSRRQQREQREEENRRRRAPERIERYQARWTPRLTGELRDDWAYAVAMRSDEQMQRELEAMASLAKSGRRVDGLIGFMARNEHFTVNGLTDDWLDGMAPQKQR